MKNFITYLSLTTIGVGALVYIMETKRKRRRLLDKTPKIIYNKVAQDFGGTVPGLLFNYLKTLGNEEKIRKGYEFWGYNKVLDFSKSVSKILEGDVLIILGIERILSSELGKTVYLLYSKSGYPENLILVTHNKETGELEYYQDIDFSILS